MAIREKKDQRTSWKELGHTHLNHLDGEHRLAAENVVAAADSEQEAVLVLEYHLGFMDAATAEVRFASPIGEVVVQRANLRHIVEKRQDARERYVLFAIATMLDPLEIWNVAYEDDDTQGISYRYAYIGAFEGKTQMLVVVAQVDGRLLWNFMHGDNKAVNKRRHGEQLVYRRPEKNKGEGGLALAA